MKTKINFINFLALSVLLSISSCKNEPDPITNPPDEKSGTVYVGNLDGNLYALNDATGALKWTFKTGGAIQGTPTVWNNVLYIASWDKKLYALDPATGAKKWETGSDIKLLQPFAAALVLGNTVYYPGEHSLYAIDANTGAKKWEYADDDVYSWQASPTGGGSTVYASIRGTGNKVGIYGVDAATGARKWKAAKTHVTESSPAIADGILYAGSEYEGFNAFNINTGALVWTFNSGLVVNSSPTVANGIVYVGAGAFTNSDNDKLFALDAKTGAKKWEFKTPDGSPDYSSPFVVNGIVYIGAGGTLYAVDAVSGAKKWEAKPEANNLIYSGAVISSGLAYIGIGKKMYAFDAATGAKKWEYDTGRTIENSSPCVVDKNGTVWHAGISGMVQ